MIVAPENPIAVQLYTVREPAQADFAGTLRPLAEGGVRAVEFAGYHGMSVAALRALLDELGMRVAGSHVLARRLGEPPQETLAEVVALGGEYAVVPWVPPDRRGGAEFARSLAANMNRGRRRHRMPGWALPTTITTSSSIPCRTATATPCSTSW